MFEIAGTVTLRKGESKRIRTGHLWIYRNEVVHLDASIKPGDLVWVLDEAGRKLGAGAANPNSLICVRLLTRGANEFTEEVFKERFAHAIERRAHLACDAKRLVNAEGDLLPGLIVDLYRDVVAVQLQIGAWERRKDLIVEMVKEAIKPHAIVLRNDSKARRSEGLETYTEVVGNLDGNIVIKEGGIEVEVDVVRGQKTGYYIDQRANRLMILPLVSGRKVLDCFCYTATWAVMCARSGAREVTGLDASETVLDLARRNAARNGVDIDLRQVDVFDELPAMARQKVKYDVIILDPPSLAASRRTVSGAIRGYIHLNRLAIGLLNPGGLLVTCSCSHHITPPIFEDLLHEAASLVKRQVAIIMRGGQPEDHPALLAMPETTYLKCLVLRVI